MDETRRYFSLAEAHVAVERIRPLMSQVQDLRNQILADQPEIWQAVRATAGNGGNPALSALVRTYDRLRNLLKQIEAEGAVVKDVDLGLIDFPAIRSGREVCLCWQHGEASIQFWHDADAGFSGRRPIAEL